MSNPNLDNLQQIFIESRDDLRRWLVANNGQKDSIWLVTYKKAVGARHVAYYDIVDEALCFGWIDSLPRKLDDERTMLLLSPRRPGSAWSKINKDNVARLITQGLMTDAGLAKVRQAQEDGSWDILSDVDAWHLPTDLAEAFAANKRARAYYDRFPPSSKRGILEWILSAKSAEIRAKRIAETVRLAEQNLKANHPPGRNQGPKP